jgi:phosphatidylglycerol:prolipoprotein diacylglycerol transferase
MLMASKRYELSDSMKTLLLSFIGMALGAKFFGFLTGIYRDIGLGKPVTIESIQDTGIVYYGGLLGLTGAYALILRSKRNTLDQHSLDVLAVCIPLFHSISRIGCFLSGCCYGKIHSGLLAVRYMLHIGGQIDVHSRIPVQLLESLFEFLVFLYLLLLLRQTQWRTRGILPRYFAIYSIGRYFLEFLRGDIRRGVINHISFSQVICVVIWCVIVIFCLKQRYFIKYEEELDEYSIHVGT